MESRQPARVAVVGSGMAGLVTAHLLQRDGRQRYSVRVFESGHTLSLDAASVSVPDAARTTADRVDLPMRAFAGGFYSSLQSMYDYLGVQYRPQRFLFDFARARTPYYTHASNLHQLPRRPHGAGLLPYLLDLAYLLACYAWFAVCCFAVAPRRGETLRAYLARTRLPARFVALYLLPLLSSVTTCPHDALLAFPASDLTAYKRRTHRAPHYTVAAGVRAAQVRLAAGIQCELHAAVTAVEPHEKGVHLTWTDAAGRQRTDAFDRVVLAVAPDVVGRIFAPLQPYMARIPTAVVESVVHTDPSVLNAGRGPPAQTSSNAQLIHLNTSTSRDHQTESHHIQPCGAIVTTCPFSSIDESRRIHSAKFTRVLRSPQSQRTVNAIFGEPHDGRRDDKSVPLWRNGDDNVYLVGGWCWDGMVLLEGCVVSAMRVAEALDVDVPWRQ